MAMPTPPDPIIRQAHSRIHQRGIVMTTHLRPACVGLAVLLSAALTASSAAAGEVKIVLRDGRVTLAAENATVREILAEGARVGKTTLVNADKLGGTPITMQFQDVVESRALDALLRSAGGYILAPRVAPRDGESSVERIIIYPIAALPVASTAASASAPRPAPGPSQNMPYGRGRGGMPVSDPDDETLVGAPRRSVVRGEQGPGVVTPGVVGGAQGTVVGGRPPEASFNYANPMQLRQALEEAAGRQGANVVVGGGGVEVVGGAQVPGGMPVNPYGSSLVNPYTGQPVVAPTAPTSTTGVPGTASGNANRPGVMVPNPANQTQGTTLNPYGLPAGTRPGSVVGPPVEPDRSKYLNPPTPPSTATGRGGRGGR
jgi:hypothetical protein